MTDQQHAASGRERPIERLLRVTMLLKGENVARLRAEARAEYESLLRAAPGAPHYGMFELMED